MIGPASNLHFVVEWKKFIVSLFLLLLQRRQW